MNRRVATPKAALPRKKPVEAGDSPANVAQSDSLMLWIVLARSFNAVSKLLERDVAKSGLTGMEFGILEVLYHKGPLLLGEIQRKVLVTSGGITYLVDRLVEKGLVKREECENDRRARYAVLTPSGTALIKRIFPAHAKLIEQALAGLNISEQRQITPLLRQLGLAAEALVPTSKS